MLYEQLGDLFAQCDDDTRHTLRNLMQLVLKNGTMHKEDFVHRFIFEFWDELCDSKNALAPLQEKYFEGRASSPSHSEFYMKVVRSVYRDGVHRPDIIACSARDAATVYVIEIKNEEVDDRALGQILRYYQVVRSRCDLLAPYVRRVVPIIIAPSANLPFWDSVPFHFREVLEVCYLQHLPSGEVVLVDGKADLRHRVRGRVPPVPN